MAENWLSRRATNFLDNLLFAVLFNGAVAVLAGYGVTRLVDVESGILIGLFVFACLGVSWAALAYIAARNAHRRLATRTNSEVKRDVHEWMQRYHIFATDAMEVE